MISGRKRLLQDSMSCFVLFKLDQFNSQSPHKESKGACNKGQDCESVCSQPEKKMRHRHCQPHWINKLYHYAVEPCKQTVQEQQFTSNFGDRIILSEAIFMAH